MTKTNHPVTGYTTIKQAEELFLKAIINLGIDTKEEFEDLKRGE